jgi:hypothetical protein
VRHALVKRQQRQLEDDRRKHDCLKETFDVHSHVERSKYERLDRRLEIQTPGRESDLMPTELGNILRAAETRPKEKYGLDVIACWPRLWLVLPESATRDLIAARAELDAAVRMSIWGGLFLIWSIWAWWAVPIGACVILIGYRIALESATFYGTLIESAFDMYRLELFNKAGWSPPGKDPSEELAYGEALSLYFWRRPDSPPPESKYAPDSGPPLESPMNEEKTRTTLPGP